MTTKAPPQISAKPGASRAAATKKCKLSAISTPLLNGVHVGLNPSADGLMLCPKTFGCCGGAGHQQHAEGVRRCQLQSRYSRALALEQSYERVWGQTMPFEAYLSWLSREDRSIVSTIADMVKGYSVQCRLIQNSPLCIKSKPSVCWAMALAAIWRFGQGAEVVPFHQLKASAIHGLVRRSHGFLLVEKIANLHNNDEALRLEYLVDVAYACNVFLILEILPAKELSAKGSAAEGALKAFRKRVAADEAKPFPEHLDADCRSKLAEMRRLPNPRFATTVDPLLDDPF